MNIISGNLIGGKLSTRSSGAAFHAFNPATGKTLEPQFFDATVEEIEQAASLAHQSFETYRNSSDEQRAFFLETIAGNIEALGDGLLQTASEETALPPARLAGERARTVGQLRLFAQFVRDSSWRKVIVDEALPQRQPLPRQDIRQMQVPLGPVAVFGASNFPLAFSVAGGDTTAALAGGCPIIFKAHPAHPATCQMVAEAIAKAVKTCSLPEGVFALLHGASNEVGQKLVVHPLVKAVAFTGSFHGGKSIYNAAVRREEPIPVYAEMGSVNPVFFLPKATKSGNDKLAKNFAASVTLGTGQFCTNPGVFVLMEREESGTFIKAVEEELGKASLHAMLSVGIADAYKKGVQGLRTLCGAAHTNGDELKACLLTVPFSDVVRNPDYLEEVFGPSTVGVLVKDEGEMLAFADHLHGQLTASVHADVSELDFAKKLIEKLTYKAGRIVLNSFPTGVEVCHAMVHGGPYPATTDSRSTSVGTQSIYRFTRPVCYQNFPFDIFPEAMRQ